MLAFTIYSQLIIRWQVSRAGALPPDLAGKVWFILHLLFSPWVVTALAAAFLSGIAWMMAMTKFEISYAYPWVSLEFMLMLAFGVLLFGESFSAAKLLGNVLIMAGIAVIARG
jgi:multidrug transporter EmrE-like cation transporter